MSLQETLVADIKAAMLARDADRLATLRLLKSALGYVAIEKKTDQVDDTEFVSVVQKEVKKRRDAIEQYQQGGRADLVAREQGELAVLEHYLPRPLTEVELGTLVDECLRETGATTKKEMGQVIRAVQAKAAGRAEGRLISQLVAKRLT